MARTVEIRIILGMVLAEDFGREETIEGVHPKLGGELIAWLFKAHPKTIFGISVQGIVLRLTIAESGIIDQGSVGDGEGGGARSGVFILAPIVACAIAFKKRNDAIDSAFVGTVKVKDSISRGKRVAVFGDRRLSAGRYDEVVARDPTTPLHYREIGIGDTFDPLLQHIRSRTRHSGSVSHNYTPHRPMVFH